MRRWSLMGMLGCILLCGLDVAAQQDVPVVAGEGAARSRTQAPPLPEGRVLGQVTLADVHGPARGARLMLIPLETANASSRQRLPKFAATGLDGSFVINEVAAGDYAVAALAAGYLTPFDTLTLPSGKEPQDKVEAEMMRQLRAAAPVVTVVGSRDAHVEVSLTRGCVLFGRVLYADGLPAAQLAVIAEKQVDGVEPNQETVVALAFLKRMMLQQSNATDDQGRFRIIGLAPGSYRVSVPEETGEELAMDMSNGEPYAPGMTSPSQLKVYAGDTIHRKAARVFELSAGSSAEAGDITLPLNGLHSVSGRLAVKDGTAVNYAILDLVDTTDDGISWRTQVGASGEYRFNGIPEGTYTLKIVNARAMKYPPQHEVSAEFLDSNATLGDQRVFADASVPIILESADLENVPVLLTETKLPAPRGDAVPAPVSPQPPR